MDNYSMLMNPGSTFLFHDRISTSESAQSAQNYARHFWVTAIKIENDVMLWMPPLPDNVDNRLLRKSSDGWLGQWIGSWWRHVSKNLRWAYTRCIFFLNVCATCSWLTSDSIIFYCFPLVSIKMICWISDIRMADKIHWWHGHILN